MELRVTNTDVRTGFKRILLCVDSTASSARTAAFVPHLANKETHVRIVGVVENARAVIPLEPLAAFHLSAAHALLLQDVENACAASQELFATIPGSWSVCGFCKKLKAPSEPGVQFSRDK